MQNRIITLLNLVLALIIFGCVYYLVYEASYETPPEIRQMERALEATEVEVSPSGAETTMRAETIFAPRPAQVAINADYPNLRKDFMQPVYSPTPTPTPPPPPPPPPPMINEAVYSWRIISMDTDQVELIEERNQEVFTLRVGGPGRTATDKRGQQMEVILKEVDLNELKATLTLKNHPEQTHVIAY